LAPNLQTHQAPQLADTLFKARVPSEINRITP